MTAIVRGDQVEIGRFRGQAVISTVLAVQGDRAMVDDRGVQAWRPLGELRFISRPSAIPARTADAERAIAKWRHHDVVGDAHADGAGEELLNRLRGRREAARREAVMALRRLRDVGGDLDLDARERGKLAVL